MEDLVTIQHAHDRLDESVGVFDAGGPLLALGLTIFAAVGTYPPAGSRGAI